jgi:streptogramin lyase
MTRPRRRRAAGLGATVLWAMAIAGCSSSPTAPQQATARPTTSGTPSETPQASATGVAGDTPSAASGHTATLAGCPTTPARASSLPVIWRGGQPDDLAVAGDGSLWISDLSTGTVIQVAGGRQVASLGDLDRPEGLVALPDGSLLVAEQGHNQVSRASPDRSRPLIVLPSAPPTLGLDGLGFDTARQRVLIPDSPHGTLLSLPLQGGNATQLARNLGRDVGATPAADGGVWVVAEAEAPGGLLHVPADGAPASPVGHLAQLDDVIVLNGLLYVTDLRGLSVHAVDPATGADRVIATGFGEPQGLVVLPDGRLAVADSPRGVVIALPPCG